MGVRLFKILPFGVLAASTLCISVADADPLAPPYRFAGTIEQQGKSRIVLMRGNVVVPVSVGQVLDEVYRVEALDSYEVSLRHLPSGQIVVVTSRSPSQAPLATDGNQASAAGRARVSWEGPDRVRSNARFSIALRVHSERPVRSSNIQLRFDPALLDAVDVQPGKHYADGGLSHRVDDAGRIEIRASRPAAAPAVQAELVVLTFRSMHPAAEAKVLVENLALDAAPGQWIPLDGLIPFSTAIAP